MRNDLKRDHRILNSGVDRLHLRLSCNRSALITIRCNEPSSGLAAQEMDLDGDEIRFLIPAAAFAHQNAHLRAKGSLIRYHGIGPLIESGFHISRTSLAQFLYRMFYNTEERDAVVGNETKRGQ
jgi:hypothetical protein